MLGGYTPLLGYIDMYGPKGYSLLALWVRNKVSILAILVSNQVLFLYSCLKLGL